MDRRFFLKLTGLAAVAGTLGALPAGAQVLVPRQAEEPSLRPPGTYQIQGRVRLEDSLVEISGITNAQQISWSSMTPDAPAPIARFTSFEHFDVPWAMPAIQVRGGQLETLSVAAVDFG